MKAHPFIPHVFESSSTFFNGILAILVGLATGAAVWLFKWLINFFIQFFYTDFFNLFRINSKIIYLLIPMFGGFCVGLISYFFLGKEESKGVTSVIEACALGTGKLPYKKMPFRVLASAISIGAGASVGPEDPSVQIGSNLGSLLGKRFHLPEEKVKSLVFAGAAAGIAAAFNAPIAGIFFSFEVLLGQMNAYSFTFAALATVSSAILTQTLSGSQPAFAIPAYTFKSVSEILYYLLLGCLAGLASAFYIFLIHYFRRQSQKIQIPGWLFPILTGLILGLIGLVLPQTLGIGYSTITAILTNQSFPTYLLVFMLLGKLIMTPLSINGGFVGGVFAPSLFIGASLGGLVAQVSNSIAPGSNLTIPAFALVGMAAVLAGTIRAPMTAILLLFEMTNDYHIILPLTFSVVISLMISKKLISDSVYLFPLREKGIFLQNGLDIGLIQSIKIREIISSEVDTIPASKSIPEVIEILSKKHKHGLPVVDEFDNLLGVITFQDIENIESQQEISSIRASDICTQNPQTVFADDTVATAFQWMAKLDIGHLPVVDRNHPLKLIGMVEREDIIRVYNLEITRRETKDLIAHKKHLSEYAGLGIYEFTIQPQSKFVGKTVSEVAWPSGMTITSIRRKGRTYLPHGSTFLLAGDTIIILAEAKDAEATHKLCANEDKQINMNDHE